MNVNARVRRGARLVLVVTSLVAPSASYASIQPPAPDNSKVNARDRQRGQPTADQQKNNKSDVEITSDIRKALMADKDLSTYAHNVKVITRSGKVTLKGPVRSAAEKATIEAKAAEVAGAANVTSQISIANKETVSKKAGS